MIQRCYRKYKQVRPSSLESIPTNPHPHTPIPAQSIQNAAGALTPLLSPQADLDCTQGIRRETWV